MLKKTAIGAVVAVLVLTLGAFLWAQRVFGGEGVKGAVERQMTRALGQPVRIGSVSAGILPRVSLTLDEVTIGDPVRVHAERLRVGTNLGALISRRIEQAAVELTGVHLELPIAAPGSTSAAAGTSEPAGSVPLEIVSVDTITATDLQVSSGGRVLRGDLEMSLHEGGLDIHRLDLEADGETVRLSGRITDLTRPAGNLALTAGHLSIDQLLVFASDFVEGAAGGAPSAAGPAPPSAPAPNASAMDLTLAVHAEQATVGGLDLSHLAGRARVTPEALAFEAIEFEVFGGRYTGTLELGFGAIPPFRLTATLSGLDMGQATEFAGAAGAISGRLSGQLELTGRGLTTAGVLESARGTARVDLVDGVVQGLGLVRGVVLATSMRDDAAGQIETVSVDEPFSSLGSTLTIEGPRARTDDLRFQSQDLLVAAAGTIGLDGQAVDLEGQVQLSEALSQQAGRDLLRYTEDDGRVTLPVRITGSAGNLQVRIDMGDAARRALINRAEEEASEAIREGLGRLLGR